MIEIGERKVIKKKMENEEIKLGLKINSRIVGLELGDKVEIDKRVELGIEKERDEWILN